MRSALPNSLNIRPCVRKSKAQGVKEGAANSSSMCVGVLELALANSSDCESEDIDARVLPLAPPNQRQMLL